MSRTDLVTVDGRPALRLERRLAHPVARVWRAVSDPAELAAWFVGAVAWEPRAGERFSAGGADGEITACDPPHVLAWTHGTDAFRFDLRADGDAATVLVFTHVLADAGPAAQHAAGWDGYLDRLYALLAGGALAETDAHGAIAMRHEHHAAAFGVDPAPGRRTIAGMAFRDPVLREEPGAAPVVRVERRLACPPERLFRALDDPDERARWFPVAVPLEITRREPPRRLEGTWGGEVLRFEVRPDGDGSVLVLEHVLGDRATAARTAAGWDRCLARLEAWLGGVELDERTALELWPVVHERLAAAWGVDPAVGRDAFAAHPLT